MMKVLYFFTNGLFSALKEGVEVMRFLVKTGDNKWLMVVIVNTSYPEHKYPNELHFKGNVLCWLKGSKIIGKYVYLVPFTQMIKMPDIYLYSSFKDEDKEN